MEETIRRNNKQTVVTTKIIREEGFIEQEPGRHRHIVPGAVCALVLAGMMMIAGLPVFAAPQSMEDGRTFDPVYYAETNADVQEAVGDDAQALYTHYKDHGKTEGRAAFDPSLVDADWEAVDVPAYRGNVNRHSHIRTIGTAEDDDSLSIVTMDRVIFKEDARELLPLLNDYRRNGDTWYWNSSNTKKIYQKNLNMVSYDYELEKRAQLRAAETLFMLSQGQWAGHTRPDKYRLTSESLITINQPISMSAQEALEQWKEDDEDYAGQGHRRALLARFQKAGFAHAMNAYGEVWVQELGSPYSSEPGFVWPEGSAIAYDYETPVTVTILYRNNKTK